MHDSAWLSKDGRTAEGPHLTLKNLEREDNFQKQRQGSFKGLGGLSIVKEWETEGRGRERRGGKRSLLEDAFLEGYTVVFRWAKVSTISNGSFHCRLPLLCCGSTVPLSIIFTDSTR